MTPDALISHVREQAAANPDRRLIVALVGPPGVGKSTVTRQLVDALGPIAADVPMDGFHLSNEVLRRHGTHDRKGAPETFDAAGFAALLTRLRNGGDDNVYAPRFHREIEESLAAEIEITPEHRVIITEGNYLLLDVEPWSQTRELIDLAVYLELDETIRIDRLIERHIQFGKSPEAAQAWATGTDQRNAELITASAPRADVRVDLTGV